MDNENNSNYDPYEDLLSSFEKGGISRSNEVNETKNTDASIFSEDKETISERKKHQTHKKTEKHKDNEKTENVLTSKKAETKNYRKIRRLSYVAATLLFIFTLSAGAGVSMAFFERPSFSESEKRELAKFPSFSFTTLFDGSFFDDINLWFSDTFPFRDSLISASTRVKSLLGIGGSVYNFTENNGDEIPDAENMSQGYVDVTVDQNNFDNDIKPALPAGSNEPIGSGQTSGDNVVEQALGAVYVYGNTAYEYYNFVESTADKYISAVNSASDSLKGSGIDLYTMIIPTSIDITLNETSRSKLNSSDQKQAINYMYSKMNGDVKKVMLFDLLKAHNSEYIYFRTDHHWTSLGGYYAYAQFMNVKGAKYEPLSNFTQYKFDNFLGSFYSDTGKSPALGATPDTVYAYKPNCNYTFKMKQKGDSDFTDYPLICDATDFSSSYKYLCFIGGDQPISVIENTDMASGESCVLVKESFGNCFAPYLTCNYKYVYIIDYRYFDGDITDFAKEKGIKDIILANNTSMTRNASLVDKLASAL